jgi:hypothetical protein
MKVQEIMSEAFRADRQWAHEHIAELHDQYEEQWVAVVDQQVVAVGPNLSRVEAVAARKTGRNPQDIYVTFLESRFAVYGPSLLEI